MKQYRDLVKHVMDNGTKRANRTGVDTLSTFHYSYTLDMRDGFPLLTAKKINFDNILFELLFFLSGADNTAFLEKHEITFWRPWTDEYGNINSGYGQYWRKYPDVVPPEHDETLSHVPANDIVEPDFTFNKSGIVGLEQSSNYGTYRVIREFRAVDSAGHDRSFFDVQFLDTGYIQKRIEKQNVKKGNVRDPFFPRQYGVGFHGHKVSSDDHALLFETWKSMLGRCYHEGYGSHKNYGAKGVVVVPRWHCFSSFVEDCKLLPNWDKKIKSPDKYTLDKDYYGYNYYSPNTCVWSTWEQQHRNKKANVRSRTRVGEFDQFAAIVNALRNPNTRDSRRLCLTNWFPPHAFNAPLPCCHCFSVFNVQYDEDGPNLNLEMLQRSCDVPVGVSFNIASYGLLLELTAHLAGLPARKFGHTLVDVHIYENQLPGITKYMSREPGKLPTLTINGLTNLQELDTLIQEGTTEEIRSHFVLEGYNPQPFIRMPVAV